jgi:hypothetical protein
VAYVYGNFYSKYYRCYKTKKQMAYVKFDKARRYRDNSTGEVFTAERITNASYSKYKGTSKASNWKTFRKGNSVENYTNGIVGFINPNTKQLATFVATDATITPKSTSTNNSKTEKGMKKLNLEMGPVKGADFKLTFMGTIAVKTANGYRSYNPESGELTDVDGFTMDFDGMFYKMPAAELEEGDLISTDHGYGYVLATKTNKVEIMLMNGDVKKIVSTTSPFGFSFYTKIVSISDMADGSDGDSGMFGGMDPMMLMMMGGGNSGNGSSPFGGDMIQTLMMSKMLGGKGGFGNLFGKRKGKKNKKG